MAGLVVMLTGGIGSGKTAVSNLFAKLGVDVVDSDVAARAIMNAGEPAYEAVRARFGDSVLLPDGALDRAALRQRIFADTAQRRWLEQLTHPLINAALANGVAKARPPYCILVVPLFVPGHRHRLAQRTLVVDAPEHLQVNRTMQRDNNNADQVRSIMAAQATREQRLAGADDVIVNDGTLEDLELQVRRLDGAYRSLGSTT